MANRFKTGTRTDVMLYMAECAIRDRREYANSLAGTTGYEDEQKLTNEEIADFCRIRDQLKRQV